VEQPIKFELVINMKTAGLRADDPAIVFAPSGRGDRVARGPASPPTVTDRLGRLLLVTLEAARIGALLVRVAAFG
jgi:hypothetical protein